MVFAHFINFNDILQGNVQKKIIIILMVMIILKFCGMNFSRALKDYVRDRVLGKTID